MPVLLERDGLFCMEREDSMNAQEQYRIIAQGTQTIIGEEELLHKLEEGRPLRIKFGLDPSAPDIHLGHAVPLRKLRQMQELGHEVIIVIGDFTGRIGDPTGKSKGRAALSEAQVRENAQTYCDQVFHILRRDRTRVVYNSEWLAKLDFEEVIRLASTVTVARLLERDDFQNRYRNQVPIGLHEFFYPLMQAYDSVAIQADVEMGGSDQTFNILMGRSLQKEVGQEPQAALFMPILEGLDGKEKMSKSLGNTIGVQDAPEVMFKKVMELPDGLLLRYYQLCTDEHPDTVAAVEQRLAAGANPRDEKYILAGIITGLYHTPEETAAARTYYDAAFAQKGVPEDIPAFPLPAGATLRQIAPRLGEMGLIASNSELLRLLKQGGASLDGEKLPPEAMDAPLTPGVLKLGKKRFVRLEG